MKRFFLVVTIVFACCCSGQEAFAVGVDASFCPHPWIPSGVAPYPQYFNNTSTGGAITGYQWIINGVVVSNAKNFFYVFKTEGYFEITLTVSGQGGSDSWMYSISVVPVAAGFDIWAEETLPPKFEGRYRNSPNEIVGNPVYFFDETEFSSKVDIDSCKYTFDFDDGPGSVVETERGFVLSHKYKKSGEYYPGLMVSCPGYSGGSVQYFYLVIPPPEDESLPE